MALHQLGWVLPPVSMRGTTQAALPALRGGALNCGREKQAGVFGNLVRRSKKQENGETCKGVKKPGTGVRKTRRVKKTEDPEVKQPLVMLGWCGTHRQPRQPEVKGTSTPVQDICVETSFLAGGFQLPEKRFWVNEDHHPILPHKRTENTGKVQTTNQL